MLRNLNAVGRGRVRPLLGFAAVLLTILFVGGSAQAAPADYSFLTLNFGVAPPPPGDIPFTPGMPFTTQTPVGPGNLTTGFTVTPLGMIEVEPGVYGLAEFWTFNQVNPVMPLVAEIADPDLFSYHLVGESTLAPLTWDGVAPVYGANFGSSDPLNPWYSIGWGGGAVLWFSDGGVPEPAFDILGLGLTIAPHPLGLGFDVIYAAQLGGLLDQIEIASNALDPTDPTISWQQNMYVTGANIVGVDGLHVGFLVTNVVTQEVPEPSTGLLLGGALAGLALLLKRTRA